MGSEFLKRGIFYKSVIGDMFFGNSNSELLYFVIYSLVNISK